MIGQRMRCGEMAEREKPNDMPKDKETALEFERARMRALLDNMDQGFALVDKDQRLIALNQKMIDQFGYPEHLTQIFTPVSEIFGFQIESGEHDHLAGNTDQKVQHLVDELMSVTAPVTKERQRRDGTVLEIWTKRLPDDSIVRTFTDITKRKAAERALQESEHRLVEILSQSPITVVITDEDDRIVFASAANAGNLKRTSKDFVGRRATEFYVDPDHRASLLAQLRRDGAVSNELVRLRRPAGTEFWGLISMSSIQFDGADAVLVWSYDVTHLKEVEESLRAEKERTVAALAELKEAQENLIRVEKMASLGSLTAGIAHEIKNPLNFINNFSETSVELLYELREALAPAIDALSETARGDIDDLIQDLVDDLQTISSHGRRADGIVRTMLLLARGAVSERVACDLNALVDESLKLAYHGERARTRDFNISIEQELDPRVGHVAVARQELSRVFINLFSNAFDATRKRKEAADEAAYQPSISVRTRRCGTRVEISVKDNGTGIAEENLGKVFTPFFTTKPTGEGTGLGLSLSHDIVVQQHDGSLDVRSEEGVFTEFVIGLPVTGSC